MDGRAMALNQRRRAIGEAVELEREREAALLEQLEEMFAELEGPALDEEVLAQIAPADAELVRSVLRGYDADEESPEAGESDEDWLAVVQPDPATERDELLAEVARLQQEIALSRRRRDAYERYVEALDS
ncbi:MAG TPA: hypothetical protein VFR38_08335 [Gaiellaceae bacterium]|nr:hypothetical protein [Gaiellaceae bacterium]